MKILILFLLVQYQMSSKSLFVNAEGTPVLDLSDLLYDPATLDPGIQAKIETRCSQDKNLTVFYETYLETSINTRLDKIVDLFTKHRTDQKCQLRLLISLKYTRFSPDEYKPLAKFVANRTVVIAGVTVKNEKKNLTGNFSENLSVSNVQTFKTESSNINVGYAFDYTVMQLNSHDCTVFSTQIQEVDYLIVKVLFGPNDTRAVESYEIFKKNMNAIYKSTQTCLAGLNGTIAKTLYYKIDFQFTNDTDPNFGKRHKQLLNEHLMKWALHNVTIANIIINCPLDCLDKSNGGNMTWMLQYPSFNFFGHMPYFAGGAGLLICILLGIAGIRFKQSKSRLTQKEVQEFYNGQMDLIRQAVYARRHNTIYIGNFYDGLVYQRSFEWLKPVVTLALKNGQFLGKNKYSTTYRCRVERQKKDIVALKVIKKGCPTEIFKGYLSEVKLLCYLGDHNNIVTFWGCHTKEIQNCTIWSAMEFCEGGSLLTYLQNKTVGEYDIDFQELVKFCRDIACGMQYIADQDVIHGDLSARQVLLDHKLTCKIKGLGLMRKITVYQTYVKKSQWEKIPWQWIAPESLRKFVFSSKSDVWSFGILVWEIFSLGETPYPEITWKPGFIHDVEKGMRMESPPLATKAIFDVMKECWDITPEKRPDFLILFDFFGNLMSREASSASSANYETSL